MAKVRDLVSGLTHCIAAGLSLIGLVILIVFASIWGNAYHIVSFTIFGSSLFLLYLFSTLYHWLNIGEKGLSVFRKFDHIMIYIFIAASYTPVCLTALRGAWGWSIFGVQWGLALLGTIFSAIWIKAPRWVTTSIYIAMGWIIVFVFRTIISTLPIGAFLWLLAGGIIYTIGGVLYALKLNLFNSKHTTFGSHEIFPLFVLGGSICHFIFMYIYVA